jgi:hypothetical protein
MGSLDSFCSQFDLKSIVKEKRITTFVETGCHLGHTISQALYLGFDRLYSCDIDEKYVEHCRNRFKNQDWVVIEHSTSVDFLENLMPRIANVDSVVFFLDAHLPELDSSVKISLPLEAEMDIIWKYRSHKHDHLAIDDLRIYEENDFTGGNWKDRALYGNPNLDFLNKYNYKVQKSLYEEGYLYLTN